MIEVRLSPDGRSLAYRLPAWAAGYWSITDEEGVRWMAGASYVEGWTPMLPAWPGIVVPDDPAGAPDDPVGHPT